jgi:hypothetical protein
MLEETTFFLVRSYGSLQCDAVYFGICTTNFQMPPSLQLSGFKIFFCGGKAVVAWPLSSFYCLVFFFLLGEWAPQLMLQVHHSLKAFCATLWWRWAVFLPSCTSNGAPVEWNLQGKTDNSEKNLSQCHFVHHKSHMDLTWDRNRASVVRGRRLSAWAMARPFYCLEWV